jgi:hypothetical protein
MNISTNETILLEKKMNENGIQVRCETMCYHKNKNANLLCLTIYVQGLRCKLAIQEDNTKTITTNLQNNILQEMPQITNAVKADFFNWIYGQQYIRQIQLVELV